VWATAGTTAAGSLRSTRTGSKVRNVLVVDDEVEMLTLLRHFLDEKGFHVDAAHDVGEAIAVLERGLTDAVVLDVRMPQRSGLELLEFIRFDPVLSEIPVLIHTGATLTPREEAAIACGRGMVFYKSENLEALAAQLDQLTT
jgi:CheY-like chemotaxis protein